jgi:plastocyanin
MLVGCSSGIGRPPSEVIAHADAKGVQRVRVVAHTFWFEPNRILVKAGQPVELTIRDGSWLVPHNLTCNAADAGIEVSGDVGMFHRGKTMTFTPTKPGEYEFFCHVDAHSRKGMKGVFVVVP